MQQYSWCCLHSSCVRSVITPETINNCTGTPYQPAPTTQVRLSTITILVRLSTTNIFGTMFTCTKEILKTLCMFPSHYLLPQVTKINVTDLGIKRCLPTACHYTPYRHARSGRRVFIKLCSTARSIATNISLQRCTTPKQSKPNFNNLHTIPNEHKDQPGTDDNKVHLSLVNTRSLPSKGEELKYYITEKAINICTITETWIHKDATEESLKAVTPEGYVISSKPHLDGHRGGGIGLIYTRSRITRNFKCGTFDSRYANFGHFSM